MKISACGALFALVVLAGCTKTVQEMSYTERKALADQIVHRCMEQGVKLKTAEMDQCTFAEAQREVATRNRQASIEDARRSRGTTVCNRIGYTVICN